MRFPHCQPKTELEEIEDLAVKSKISYDIVLLRHVDKWLFLPEVRDYSDAQTSDVPDRYEQIDIREKILKMHRDASIRLHGTIGIKIYDLISLARRGCGSIIDRVHLVLNVSQNNVCGLAACTMHMVTVLSEVTARQCKHTKPVGLNFVFVLCVACLNQRRRQEAEIGGKVGGVRGRLPQTP